MDGATEVCRSAGIAISGGHSLELPTPLFGLAATGTVHPKKIWTNSGAQPGDVLFLTKALGTGVATNARKSQLPHHEVLFRAAVDSMRTLNKGAADAIRPFSVHAATDVTGFGIGAHALEMARGSSVGIQLFVDSLPLLPGAEAILRAHEGRAVLNASHTNLSFCGDAVTASDRAQTGDLRPRVTLTFDPQTSGGLLIAVPATEASQVETALIAHGAIAAKVGVVFESGEAHVSLCVSGETPAAAKNAVTIPYARVRSHADATSAPVAPAAASAAPSGHGGKVLLFTRPHMGDDGPLGRKLVRGLLGLMAAAENVALPATIFVANTGIELTTGDDEFILKALAKLVERGVDVVTCVTCTQDLHTCEPKVGRLGTAAESLRLILGDAPYVTLA
eukprot:gnl/Ergobibamus_cyprinoides/81.p1 GENE.gnl/Ergobibamus_cyprinoides/81~~gnl/Ergobibamus_cyprinoides/81.p1  ORF type:complete len:392 (-),score=100.52 gnl/Ergobibamus_cyprinoides/81:117-1292(-)